MPSLGAAPRRALAALALLALSSLALAQNVTQTCPDGFAGPSCALCQSDAACAAATGDAAATCSKQLAFGPESTLKAFACGLPADTLVGGLLEPGSLLVQCTPAAAECSLGFTVKSGGVAVGCEASGCAFVDGQPALNCSATACSCPADATCGNQTLISGLVSGVKGGASLTCDAAGACSLKISGLPISELNATCEAADCITNAATAPAPAPEEAVGPAGAVGAMPSPAPLPAPSPSTSPSGAPAAQPYPTASPSPSAAPAPSPTAESPATATGGSACPSGWMGAQCALCQSDAACAEATGDPAAACSTAWSFAPNSVLKAFSCELPFGTFISDLIKPGTLLVRCATGQQPAASGAAAPAPEAAEPGSNLTTEGAVQDMIAAIPSGSGRRLHTAGSGGGHRQVLQAAGERYCNISFTVANPAVVDVACSATDCIINPGTAKVECANTVCSCPGTTDCNNGIINGLVQGVYGRASINCDAAGACSIKLTGLPIAQLDATCQAGECLVPSGQPPRATEVTSQSHRNLSPTVASLLLLALLTAALGS